MEVYDFITQLLVNGKNRLENRLPKGHSFSIESIENNRLTYKYFDTYLNDWNTGRIYLTIM